MKSNFGKIIEREDGSYVIRNGTYHVPNTGRYAEKWQDVHKYALDNPEMVEKEVLPQDTEQTETEIQERLTRSIQGRLDKKAKELLYDSCLSVCSYVDTGVQKFDAEGRAFRKWRSAVWEKGYEILDQVKAGQRDIPTEAELLAELPELVIVYEESISA